MRTGIAMWRLRAIASLLAVFVTACGGEVRTPATPTPIPSPTPTPTPTFDFSPYAGVWDLTWRQTELEDTGHGGCVAETMRSKMGMPITIVLTVTKSDMTITNPWGDHVCTYGGFKVDDDGIGFGGGFVRVTCEPPTMAFTCSDGTRNDLMTWGFDLHGRLSGHELVGEYSLDWFEAHDSPFYVGSSGTFTGTRR